MTTESPSVSLSRVPVASLVTLVLFSAYTNKNRKVYLVTSQVFFFFFQINFWSSYFFKKNNVPIVLLMLLFLLLIILRNGSLPIA